MIPFDPPQTARVGLVAALDNHLRWFIIGQHFHDKHMRKFLLNQYFHDMINSWMTTFFLQICQHCILRSSGFYLICAVHSYVGWTDLHNRRIEHLWWRNIIFVSTPHVPCIFLWKHLFTLHTEQIMEKRNDMADLISKNAKTDLLTDRPEDVCPSSEAPRCRTPAHRSALHRTLARCPQTWIGMLVTHNFVTNDITQFNVIVKINTFS